MIDVDFDRIVTLDDVFDVMLPSHTITIAYLSNSWIQIDGNQLHESCYHKLRKTSRVILENDEKHGLLMLMPSRGGDR